VPSVFQYESGVLLVVDLVLLAIKIFAFVSALTYASEAYVAAGKATKPAWAIGLGIGVALQAIGVSFFLISIAFTVAALVFLADVRPALAGLRRR
jgi:hypothetical protein